MNLTYVDDLGSTPARVNRETGEVFWNRKFDYLPEHIKTFILWHEIGHYKMQTSDEIEADDYAFKQYAGSEPYSMKNSIEAMTQIFSFRKEIHWLRIYEHYKRVLKWDWENKGNKEAKKELDEMLLFEENMKKKHSKNLINGALFIDKT